MDTICLICGHRLDLWFSRLQRDVYRCAACRHITVPAGVVRDATGASIYETDESIFSGGGNADYYFDDTNVDAAREKVAFVDAYARAGGRLLDVGASFGHFLAEARSRYEASGIEMSPSAVNWARSHFGVDVEVGSIYDLKQSAYDVITSWDVIEHLEDPVSALDRLRAALAPRGRLFLSTPDAGALVARLMGRRWHYLDPVQHLHLFSRAHLTRVAAARGLRLVAHRYFGRGYRVDYIASRLHYLAFGSQSAHGHASRVMNLPLGRLTVPIKLWDVMGLVFEAAA